MNKWVVRASVLLIVAVILVWWFIVADWLNSPHSPRAGIFYTAVVLISSGWHLRALYRFSKMTQRLRKEERAGLAPPGATTFAANQRFRYLMRALESVVVLAIGILAIVAAYRPEVTLNPNYIRLVLTYFIWSILLTGYLTMRDLWVINKVRALAQDRNDEATLVSAKRKEPE